MCVSCGSAFFTQISNWIDLNFIFSFAFIFISFSYSTSNLPWFMDLTFHVPMQYCSLQHQTLPDASTTGHYFHCGSASLFLLELFLHSSPVAYWTPKDLGDGGCSWRQGFIFQYHIFLPFHTVYGVLKARMLSGMSLLQWTIFCQNSLPWPVHLGWPYTAWFIVSLS